MPHPASRVLAVLELLQSRGRISGPELAQRINVDVRTLRRYIVLLEELGIPITTERGRHGAYMLVAGFKLPPMMFTDAEALALSMGLLAARSLGLHADESALASAQAKLERVMPDSLKRRLRAVETSVSIESPNALAMHANATALMLLTHAAHAAERVHLHYRSAQGEESERDFDAYGLGFRGGAWYTVGHCHLRHGVRGFRVDRIVEVHPLPVRFTRPRHFDVLAWLNRSIATLPRAHRVEVLLRTDLAKAREAFSPAIGLFEEADGGVLLCVRTDDLAWFARQLARVPFDFEIRTPQRLRKELLSHLTQLQKLAAN
ncbi:MAG: YafY family transcriptional regulator [Xanthomonadales bacterium]|nr:YafY family transcriptional regulator [Xanthomonadales bacterium]ODU92721.1 MAG: transcriptional regulator [Rhodanobacter sp. SCN 66-43]OJY83915.1 MAG: transcriptional regulator [Xanthomonadales bacterium 66-474]